MIRRWGRRTDVLLNGRLHAAGLAVFAAVVVAHWAEHILQAIQVWVLDWPRDQSRGAIGQLVPWLFTSEWLHYWFAVVMLLGFIAFRRGFSGHARAWWDMALGIQVWHHLEHLLLLGQALLGVHLAARPVPTSVLQLFVPRVELHLFYNAVVTVPMLVAMYLHRYPSARELAAHPVSACSCSGARQASHASAA
jgi:hypothetical protein